MTDKLSADQVAHVARLARLFLSPEEIETFTGQLSAVLEYAQALVELDVDSVAPTAHPLSIENVYREDVVRKGCDRDEVLREAPASEDGRFKVPRILGEQP